MTNDRLVPTKPSNKNVLEQAQLWGWTIRSHSSEWVELQHSERTERVKVRPATFRSLNPHDVLHRLYQATCNGSAETFWKRDDPYFDKVREQRQAKHAAGQMTDEELEAFAAAKRSEYEDAPPPTPPEDEPETAPVPAPIVTIQDVYGIAPRPKTMESNVLNVFDALAPSDVTIQQVSTLLGLTRMEASNTVSRLVRRGLVLRDPSGRKGIWRRSGLQPQDSVRPAAAAPILTPVVVTQTPLVLVPTPAPAVTADVVDDLLDLLFPDGIRARHLDLVEQWRQLTRRMIDEVTG